LPALGNGVGKTAPAVSGTAARNPRGSLEALLQAMLQTSPNVSDLIFSPGRPPQVEVRGQLLPCAGYTAGPLSSDETRRIASELLGSNQNAVSALREHGSCDTSYGLTGIARFRVNVFIQRGSCAVVMRVIPTTIPDFAALHLPAHLADVANLRAENVDWEMRVIGFNRMKTGSVVQLSFGSELANILNDLPGEGFLLPRIAMMKESDRAKAFIRRCGLTGVSGVSLHSYRYSWAERAKEAGYPERFAQENLGHCSKAVTRAYAKKAKMKLPSLEEYEKKAANKLVER